jgi:hypothetical protein
MAVKNLGLYYGAAFAVMALAKLAGAAVDDDPKSADFGKVVIGNRHIEILPETVLARYIWQAITGKRKEPMAGVVQKYNRMKTTGRFLRTKMAPTAGLAYDLWAGYDIAGEPTGLNKETFLRVAPGMLTPLAISDIASSVIEQGFTPDLLVLTPYTLAGGGMQTYGVDRWPEDVAAEIRRIQANLPKDKESIFPGRPGDTLTVYDAKGKSLGKAAMDKKQYQDYQKAVNAAVSKSIRKAMDSAEDNYDKAYKDMPDFGTEEEYGKYDVLKEAIEEARNEVRERYRTKLERSRGKKLAGMK